MAEYSRPNRVPMNQMQPGTANVAGAPVRVSFLTLNTGNKSPSPRTEEQDDFDCDENYREDLATADRICFNVGRELYVYLYNLIIGFSAGQIQLIDPFHKEYQASRLYNEERFIDKTGVTCLRWVPGKGDKYSVYTCKAKTTRNPVYRWQIGEGGINQFAFSGPDAKMLATVGHDGYLRIFNYHQMELLSYMKSYFGGLLTLGWSPDAKLIVTGGEDDLLTVYNVQEKRVVCRGQGHKSWISQVQFDPYMCTIDGEHELNGIGALDIGSDDERLAHTPYGMIQNGQDSRATTPGCSGVCYRIGSVGHDTQLCLWDITEDMLK
ncbi:WD domain, G-beta repeat protein, partial [Teladorsagia circumcincta]